MARLPQSHTAYTHRYGFIAGCGGISAAAAQALRHRGASLVDAAACAWLDGPVAITLYHYSGCSTCKKARKWLDAHGVEHTAVDIVSNPPSKATLARLREVSGLPVRKLFNTSGQSYRTGGFKEKLGTMSEDEALDALAADGKLIKRPLMDGGDFALVGFDENRYRERFG